MVSGVVIPAPLIPISSIANLNCVKNVISNYDRLQDYLVIISVERAMPNGFTLIENYGLTPTRPRIARGLS